MEDQHVHSGVDPAAAAIGAQLRDDLLDRKRRLEAAMAGDGAPLRLAGLMQEVDAALARIEVGRFGLCETCGDSVEAERLACNPLIRFCLDHLTSDQRSALQRDLDTAARIQNALLPAPGFELAGWEVDWRYRPAGPVSGDYIDLVSHNDGAEAYFAFADVSGKGISASILMANLQAIFRGLVGRAAGVGELLADANRMFGESTLANHYATAVFGRVGSDGVIELGNAGHWSPLVARNGRVRSLPSNGLPLGLFCGGVYSVERVELEPGEAVVLYTDGLTEGTSPGGEEYGEARLRAVLERSAGHSAEAIAEACLADLASFQAGALAVDDVSVMVMRRAGG